jgi:hypothetical protein
MRRAIWILPWLAACASAPSRPGVELPIVAAGPLAVVEGRLDGAGPYTFAIDTGVDKTVIDKTVALRLAGGRIAALELGGLTLRDVPFDEDELGGVSGTHGILGVDVLHRFNTTIDPADRKVTLLPRGVPPQLPPGGVEIPFELTPEGRILARGKLEGVELVWWIHLGFSHAPVVATLEKYLEAEVGVSTAVEAAKRGETRVTMVLLKSVAAGGLERRNQLGLAGAFPKGLPGGESIGGIVSAAFFGPAAALTFDFDRGVLRVQE